jgi:hypothetical protein
MTSKVLAAILTQHGKCKQEGSRYLLPSEVGASVYIAIGSEALTVDNVNELVLEPDVVIAVTSRSERYVMTYEDIRALRFHGRGRATGYGAG